MGPDNYFKVYEYLLPVLHPGTYQKGHLLGSNGTKITNMAYHIDKRSGQCSVTKYKWLN